MKRAIVVGASSGIGRALAKMLAQAGYRVGVTGRRADLLEGLCAEFPEQMLASAFDVSELEETPARLQALSEALGGLDLLIISAAVYHHSEERLNFERDQRLIQINVSGFTCVANWAFNFFKVQGHGHLVGISSMVGLRGSALLSAYAASKAYQISYLDALNKLAFQSKLPIVVTDIRPGAIDTTMTRQDFSGFYVSSVEACAQQILKQIRRKSRYAYVTKRWILVAAALRCLPNFIYRRLSMI